MFTVVLNPQRLLGSLKTARVERKPVPMTSRTTSGPSKIVQPQPAPPEMFDAPAPKPAAWDPHEVWLSRVKAPREQRSL